MPALGVIFKENHSSKSLEGRAAVAARPSRLFAHKCATVALLALGSLSVWCSINRSVVYMLPVVYFCFLFEQCESLAAFSPRALTKSS